MNVDATAWVGIAGIGGTLLASLVGPVISARIQRKSTRLDRVHEQRLNAYVDMLQATARFADNALTWSAIPLVELQETDDRDLDILISRLRVIGSKEIYRQLNDLMKQLHAFNRLLSQAQGYHASLQQSGVVDDQTSIQQRMALADVADRVVALHRKLETISRDEMKR